MKKVIKIENKPDQRIILELIPIDNKIKFTGQYKPKNEFPIDIIVKFCDFDSIKENMTTILYELAIELNSKIISTNELFSIIKQMEIIEIVDSEESTSS